LWQFTQTGVFVVPPFQHFGQASIVGNYLLTKYGSARPKFKQGEIPMRNDQVKVGAKVTFTANGAKHKGVVQSLGPAGKATTDQSVVVDHIDPAIPNTATVTKTANDLTTA
jgi:hypothetical protein